MPHHARTHIDMLQVCCGICGIKKKPYQLKKITYNILIKLKSIDGYSDYDLNDDRYPKVLCSEHYSAVIERYSNKQTFKYRLPNEVLKFNEIQLSHASTRNTPTGFPSDHTCFLCDQNVVGRPTKKANTSSTAAIASEKYVCSKCLQPTGRGISHPCDSSNKHVVESVASAIKGMEEKVKDKVLYELVKSKIDANDSKSSTFSVSTSGQPANVQLNPPSCRKRQSLQEKTLDSMYTKANLTMNQMRTITGGIQSDLGRNAVPPRYRDRLSQKTRSLDEYFTLEEHRFVVETKAGVPSDEQLVWTVWAPILPLVKRVMKGRKINENDADDYMIKVMADTGQGKTKICFCICPIRTSCGRDLRKKRATYAEGGILSKASSWSGINKCIMCFCAPEIKEINSNLNKIFQLIQMEDLFRSLENVILMGDLKLLNEVYGLMEASSRHPCLYCDSVAQSLQAGVPRTIGSIKKDHAAWIASGALKSKCKNFNNVKNLPILKTDSDDTLIMKLTPPPTLHILLGIFNHIWKAIEEISAEHRRVLQEFAMRHSCMRESYWSKTFEGNECAKLMTKISSSTDVQPLLTLPGIEAHIEAIKKFNSVRVNVFGNILHENWNDIIDKFVLAYGRIPGISNPLKMHILSAHCKTFITLYGKGKGLGFYSEQTGEAIHKKFDTTFGKYRMKNIKADDYGNYLLRAVIDFSSMHI